jgi:patatin-like phospholipase/acyl hydrolase
MPDRIRILSIDGGGIRGIIPAKVIKALLGDLKAQDAFHIIAIFNAAHVLPQYP